MMCPGMLVYFTCFKCAVQRNVSLGRSREKQAANTCFDTDLYACPKAILDTL